jgi:hypothetical protein
MPPGAIRESRPGVVAPLDPEVVQVGDAVKDQLIPTAEIR